MSNNCIHLNHSKVKYSTVTHGGEVCMKIACVIIMILSNIRSSRCYQLGSLRTKHMRWMTTAVNIRSTSKQDSSSNKNNAKHKQDVSKGATKAITPRHVDYSAW